MNNKKISRVIGMVIIVILIIIFIIIVALKNLKIIHLEDNFSSVSSTEELTEEEKEKNEKLLKKLKKESESERIQTYLGIYFKYIEEKDYASAYDLLYPKFKENYFPTLEDFEEYLKEQDLPDMLTISYDDIYIQGEYYIVTVKIGDLLTRAALEQEKTLILQENGYNDYYISFKM